MCFDANVGRLSALPDRAPFLIAINPHSPPHWRLNTDRFDRLPSFLLLAEAKNRTADEVPLNFPAGSEESTPVYVNIKSMRDVRADPTRPGCDNDDQYVTAEESLATLCEKQNT